MAGWNLSCDYCSIFLVILICFWYFTEKRIPLKSHKAYLLLVINTFCSAFFEISATLMARENLDGTFPFFLILSLQVLSVNVVPVTFCYYVCKLAHININKVKPLKYLFVFMLTYLAVGLVINYPTGWLFVFENDKFVPGILSNIYYAMIVFVLVVCIYIFIRYRKNFNFLKVSSLVMLVCCGIVAIYAQTVLYVPTINFILSAALITFFYYQQNPEVVTDATTGQFNRRFMGDYLNMKFIEGKEFGIIMIAMDDFKFINKTYGVETGDQLLIQVGQFLENTERDKTTVFRFGSDQFCVLVNKNVKNLKEIAEKIESRFKHPWYTEARNAIMMSASICCIRCPQEADSYSMLIEIIDHTMSFAKKSNKGCITNACDVELNKIYNDKAIERAVKQALDKDELMVYYQPIYSVEKGRYNSAEALVRLNDRDMGWISPEDFIPIAERNGLIIQMGEIILEKVCRFIRDFDLEDSSIEYIEVNISPVQLTQPGFYKRVIDIMNEYEVKPTQINIEITETASIGSSDVVNENINRLVEHGLSFSLDDYGSGNANIDYINNMPFKIIKIDKYIIWDAFKNQKAGITLKYTIGMMNALNLNIVAEGVETEDMLKSLTDYGCHYMQGWYYSKAVPDYEFVEMIDRTA